MSAPKPVIAAVSHVLKLKAREGQTTKHDVTLLVLGKIEKMGGPTKFGIGAAMLRMAMNHIVEIEVGRQLKQTLTEHEYIHRLPAATPMDIIATLGSTPRWIAISDGVDALWKFALTATPEHWMDNAQLKHKKAQQTRDRALESEDIAKFLTANKFSCLAEALTKGV